MKPQDLMDLPYCGMAEKQLRNQGDWVYTKQEKLEKIYDNLRSAFSDIGDAMDELEEHT